MQSGPLRHQVTFDEPILAQSSSGEEIITFTPAFTLWSAVEPLTGKELANAAQVNAEIDTMIRVRWSPSADTINAKWRARFDSKIYDIKSVKHIEFQRREIQMMAVSGLNSG